MSNDSDLADKAKKYSDLVELKKTNSIHDVVIISKVYRTSTNEIFYLKNISEGFYLTHSEKIYREPNNLKALRHPNIIKIVDFWEKIEDSQNKICILTESCDDLNFEEYIKNKHASTENFTEAQVLKFLKMLTSALSYMQESCIAHREIMPENIQMTDAFQSLKISSFGSSVSLSDSTATTINFGAQYYMSPQLRKILEALRPDNEVRYNVYKSDVYSLGLIFLEMCSKKKLGKNNESRKHKIKEQLKIIKQNYPMASEIICRMVEEDEAQRTDFIDLKALILTLDPSSCIECKENDFCISFCGNLICYKCMEVPNRLFEYKNMIVFHRCFNDSIQEVSENTTDCMCGFKVCKICKDERHPGLSCFEKSSAQQDKSFFKCRCSAEIRRSVYSFFVFCEECSFSICVVCGLVFNESAHNICKIVFSCIED